MTTVIKTAHAHGPTYGRQRGLPSESGSSAASQWADQARIEAESIIQQARNEAAQIREQAAEAGRHDAARECDEQRNAHEAEARDRLQRIIDSLAENLQREQQQWFHTWQQDTVSLAIEIAARLVRRAVATDDAIVIDTVRQALELAADCVQITVQLNPDDLTRHEATLQDACKKIMSLDHWQLVPEQHISPGSCRVLTEFGEIDQTWETQLQRIAEELV